MRKLSLTADQFETFVFQQVTVGPVDNEHELETALRLLRKLKDPALTTEVPLTAAEKAAQEEGQRVFQFRKLREDEAVFLLDTDEFELLKRRVQKHKTQVAMLVLEEFMQLLQVIETAEEFKPELKKPEQAEAEG